MKKRERPRARERRGGEEGWGKEEQNDDEEEERKKNEEKKNDFNYSFKMPSRLPFRLSTVQKEGMRGSRGEG